jgi:DNA-binding MarR family transcriptional regulator
MSHVEASKFVFEGEDDYQFMQLLLKQAADYRREGGVLQISSFSKWLHQKNETQVVCHPYLSAGESVESAASKYIIYLYRYAKGYGKKLLKGTLLNSIDDLPYLLMLLFNGPSTKMELIHSNVHEKTTGMEILNRLLRLELVEQHYNPDDKRSRKLNLSPQGKILTLELIQGMNTLSEIVSGNLTPQEKDTLLNILHKLNVFHMFVHQDAKEKSLFEIQTDYLTQK